MKNGFLRAWRTRIIALSALALVAVASGAWAWDYHEEPEFCWEVCHVMEPYYRSYAEPGGNHLMAAHEDAHVECLDCHTGPGASGQAELATTSARHMKEYWITGDYDPEDLGQLPWTYPSRNCLQCHDTPLPEDVVDLNASSAPGAPGYHEATLAGGEGAAQDCYTCHSPHREGTSGFVFPPGVEALEDCANCHPEDEPVLDHALPGHDAEGCRTCHWEHRSEPEVECSDSGCHADWLREREAGVVWTDPAIHMAATSAARAAAVEPEDLAASGRAATTWVPRGNHTPADTDCLSCHDFHGAQQATQMPEQDCTTSGCHAWIPDEERPEVLLNTTETDHNGDGIDHRHVFENDGCEACHGPEHAIVVSCADCHIFSGANTLHQAHVARLAESALIAGSEGACETCHAVAGVESEGCYACHRSGHDPATTWSAPVREALSPSTGVPLRALAP